MRKQKMPHGREIYMTENKMKEVLDEIIQTAITSNDIVDFGKTTAQILLDYNLIDKAVYDILAGK
jgi:hypothetical protein